jgi:hypothetical protein
LLYRFFSWSSPLVTIFWKEKSNCQCLTFLDIWRNTEKLVVLKLPISELSVQSNVYIKPKGHSREHIMCSWWAVVLCIHVNIICTILKREMRLSLIDKSHVLLYMLYLCIKITAFFQFFFNIFTKKLKTTWLLSWLKLKWQIALNTQLIQTKMTGPFKYSGNSN